MTVPVSAPVETHGRKASGGLWPKEHGAYGQLAFPLATAFGVSGLSTAGVLLAIAVIAGFLAHEPAAVMLGSRGARARRELGARATRWLYGCLGTGIAAGLAAAAFIGPTDRWSLAVPAIPALLVVVAMVTGREKSWYGESAAAIAFAGVAVPITLAAGAPAQAGWEVAIPFALLFTTTTLAVRVVILRVRGGGNPVAMAATRRAVLTVSAAGAGVIGAMTMAGWLAPSVLMAVAPGLLTASIVAVRPPAAAHLRSLGWSLVGVSVITAVIVIATV